MENAKDSKLMVLIESVSNLSKITANHDAILTKLVDDHETRIRCLEKCNIAIDDVDKLETRVRVLENWRYYVAGGLVVFTAINMYFR
jgi:acetyl/propionyl-CoA carboxylase alpha subunit